MVGIFYGWIGLYYGNLAQMLDTWSYHQIGIAEYQILKNDPESYFTNMFFNPYRGGWGNLFASEESYWNDLKGNVFVKLLSLFDILSFGHYYVNVIFYSFISLFGPLAVYRVMNDLFPGKKIQVLLASFFIPSFLFWTSGIHKEGLIFLGLSLIIYHLYFGWKEKKYTASGWIGIISGLLILFVLRNFLMMLVIPAIVSWMLVFRWPKHGFAIFTSVYIFFGILFFNVRYIYSNLDFPQAVVDKQQSFLMLQGGASTIPIKELEPTLASFVKNTPQAITLSFLRPYPGDVEHLLSFAASFEINLLLILFLAFLFFRKKNGAIANNPLYLCFFLFLLCWQLVSASIILELSYATGALSYPC
jgi:hypothetical protein